MYLEPEELKLEPEPELEPELEPEPVEEVISEFIPVFEPKEFIPPSNSAESGLKAQSIREFVNEDQESSPDPIPVISKVTSTGKVTITFTTPMKVIPDVIDLATFQFKLGDFEWKPVMTVQVVPHPENDPEKLGMTWEYVAMSKNTIEL